MDNLIALPGVVRPLTRSLYLEVYNRSLWEWFREWGLLREAPTGQYLTFDGDTPSFHDDVLRAATRRGAVGSVLASISFARAAQRDVHSYDPSIVDAFFAECAASDLAQLDHAGRMRVFERAWQLLIGNLRYAALGSLIVQYRMHTHIPERFSDDPLAARYDAIFSLQHGTMPKSDFDRRFGFCAADDYDVSCPRYSELDEILPLLPGSTPPMRGPGTFREHVRLRTAKLIAVIRRLLLAYDDPGAFACSKEDLVAGVFRSTPRLRGRAARGHRAASRAPAVAGPCSVPGIVLCGDGSISGRLRHARSTKDLAFLEEGDILVVPALWPDIVPFLSTVRCVITAQGGALSHAAVIAREQRVPVLRLESAGELPDGAVAEIDFGSGVVVIDRRSPRRTRASRVPRSSGSRHRSPARRR